MASEKTELNSSSTASLQVADAIIVSVDTRGFSLARELALKGWKTVVIELSGSYFASETDWPDRLGPFLSWETEGHEAVDSHGAPLRTNYASVWLPSGPISFGGRMATSGVAHLKLRYGISSEDKKVDTLEKGWPFALARSALASRLARRENYLEAVGGKNALALPLQDPVKEKVSADSIARSRREQAIRAGVRVLDAEQIVAVRLSDGRVDRVEFATSSGVLVERTRSLVWMLSEEESKRVEFVGPDVPLEQFFDGGRTEPLMAWWRSRLAVRGLKRATSRTLTRVPETPPHVLIVGAVERPWTHDNLIALEVVEVTPQMRVFDVWTRIPYWARADHVYRDEQRLLIQHRLADRLVGCELVWVTPSPLALTSNAIRLSHVIYADGSVPLREKLENICFAGPESWAGIGLLGLQPMEAVWMRRLEGMRLQWDPVARLQASRVERLKYHLNNNLKNLGRLGRSKKSDRGSKDRTENHSGEATP
ncbi:hypothetical protein BH10BDE1_BH10BDE1_12050 [soil metagenome]